ncbi:MAG: hypothetical protein NC489_35535 [Ruminococcus flavefaciens]|nr:hypothetical protein [Ruminococcus flavefaciens]
MEQLINSYYENNAKKLHNVVNQIFNSKYGGTTGRDIDEFYGVASDVLVDIWNKHQNGRDTYDSSQDFDAYVYKAFYMAIKDEFKRQNRDKRSNKIEVVDENGNKSKISISDVRLDAPLGDDGFTTYGDMIQSDFDVESKLFHGDNFSDERVEIFLNNLSIVQREIIKMKIQEVPVSDIKEKLKLSDAQYNRHCNELKSFTNISLLFNKENKEKSKEDDVKMGTTTQTMENCKTDRISIASIIKKIDKHTIRFDHPLQRESDQWSPSMKGNLVSDILQGNKLHPLIFAEQIINGVPIIWDLDGKQRCTNAYSFSKNGYKVSKNIRRWMIKYQTTEKDNKGNDILDENGFPIAVNAEFDIRGKKFSDLPEELRDRFLDYSFNYDQYLNCSEEDIGYHIERYNDGKPMTSPQKGITKLGTEYAELVKSISNMPFFKDMGGYKVSEFKNGAINRVVVESIMAANYLDKWNKLEDMCKYIKDNSDTTVFDDFEDMVERLEKVVTDDVADIFDSKDSFLWFGLFARFVKTGEDDKRFVEFMTEFIQSLHSKQVDGISFDDILDESKSTKDKGIVNKKINHLEKLMNEYLSIDSTDYGLNFVNRFITENADDDIQFYEDSLDNLEENTIKDGSKLLNPENRPSLLAMMVYSYKEEVDLDDWLAEYAKNNNSYFVDQKKNFLHMKQNFEQWQAINQKIA